MNAVARVASLALQGVQGYRVMVEAGATRQLPGLAIVGLPDAALAEARQRVRMAITACELTLSNRFILVNLQPADLPKHGSGFDLPIALAVMAASGVLVHPALVSTVHLGELGLDGTLKRPRGLLTAVIAAKDLGFRRIMVPEEAAVEARAVQGIDVIAAESLRGAVNFYRGSSAGWRIVDPGIQAYDSPSPNQTDADLADVVGQQHAIRALTIAAAGRHHVHMSGPPGAGKTMLASRLVTILPDLDTEQAIEVASMHSLVSREPMRSMSFRPPFVNPHHTASAAAVVGSGRDGFVRPGVISQATHGILFLDEAPEFRATVLEALRQPLESGTIEVHRAGVHATLPARVQLVLASNPCPCGNGGSPKTVAACTCTPMQRRRYQAKISGPVRDRIDVHLDVERVAVTRGDPGGPHPVTSSDIRQTVTAARSAATQRWSGTPWKSNADVPGSYLRSGRFRLPPRTVSVLDRALRIGNLTLRGYDRTLRIAWTIADLSGVSVPTRDHVAEALLLRGGSAQ